MVTCVHSVDEMQTPVWR